MTPDWLFQVLALAIGIIGSGAVWYFLSQHQPDKALWVGWVGAVLLLLMVALYISNGLIRKEIAATAEAPNPILEHPTFREKPERIFFSLGQGGVTVSLKFSVMEEGPREPFDLRGFKPVRLYVEGTKLYADFKVFGGAEKPAVEVVHNEFTVRPPGWDRNSSATALEVVNQSGFPVFQMIYKTPSHIVVNGIFPAPGGLILANESGMVVVANPTRLPPFSLKRIFKYPSWKYPGQYESP